MTARHRARRSAHHRTWRPPAPAQQFPGCKFRHHSRLTTASREISFNHLQACCILKSHRRFRLMKITLIYNAAAGSDEQFTADQIAALIGQAGHEVVRQAVHHADWPDALKADVDVVAVAGGDGTVGAVAKALVGKSVGIAVLPLGTANNIANTLGIMNRPVEELVAEWARARHMAFDVARATGPWGSVAFIEGFGLGLFTETMARLHSRDNDS